MAPFDIAPSTYRVDVRDQSLELAVAQALSQARGAEASGFSIAFDVLGNIELPPDPSAASDQAHLNSIASLYLASELENTELVTAAETLCGVAMGGGLSINLGDAVNDIAIFWHARNERTNASERRAFYVHMFGGDAQAGHQTGPAGAASQGFEMDFIDLCEALYRVDQGAMLGGALDEAAVARVTLAGRQVVSVLVESSGGISAFIANDILSTVQSAIKLLKHPALMRAFGGHTLWDVVRAVAHRYLRTEPIIEARVDRAKSGFAVLSWLASVAPKLQDSAVPPVTLGDPVLANAATWLQSSLDLSEKLSATPGS
jgi:hypothetical protein